MPIRHTCSFPPVLSSSSCCAVVDQMVWMGIYSGYSLPADCKTIPATVITLFLTVGTAPASWLFAVNKVKLHHGMQNYVSTRVIGFSFCMLILASLLGQSPLSFALLHQLHITCMRSVLDVDYYMNAREMYQQQGDNRIA